jgi:hypothetical protein
MVPPGGWAYFVRHCSPQPLFSIKSNFGCTHREGECCSMGSTPTVAFEVGYESVSHFNREYIGQPPMGDIKVLREGKLAEMIAA